MTSIKTGRKALLAGAALAACLGFTINAQAQTCVVTNWSTQTELTDANADTPINGNRRYGGPCALKVPVNGTARFVTDTTPTNETGYLARFYVYLDDAGTDPIRIFEASDGSANQIEVWYNQDGSGAAAAGELSMTVATNGGGSVGLDAGAIGSGWHSVELTWQQGAGANLTLRVDSDDPLDEIATTADTGTAVIADASLGVLNLVSTGGTIDFDDFDSRRVERPGRLCRGDTNGSDSITQTDMLTIFNEVASGGTALAGGQPDYNENGGVSQTDFLQVLNNHVAAGDPTCP